MPYVSARYNEPPFGNGYATDAAMIAVDHNGREWSFPYDTKNGNWLAYLDSGGVIDPYVAPAVNLPEYVAQKRWDKENGGINLAGLSIATDDRSKMMIMGARIKADNDSNFTTRWKTPLGFVDIDAATIIAISDAVLAHVDTCFALEDDVLAAIQAGTITTTEQVDAAFI